MSKPDRKLSITLTESQFCALLMGAGYAVGAMHRDQSAIQGTIEWIASAADELRAAIMEQGVEEPTDMKGPSL